jgi:hypothetical protein
MFEQFVRQLEFNKSNKAFSQIQTFIDELPDKLQIQMAMFIHKARYEKIRYFQGKSEVFITWICPLLKPESFSEKMVIYNEGDEVESIFFMIKGKAGFILPRFDNTSYISIHIGELFGLIDIIGSC